MVVAWIVAAASGNTCRPTPVVHPIHAATVVVVGTIGEATIVQRGSTRPLSRVSVTVEQVLAGGTSPPEIAVVRRLGLRLSPLGPPGATVLLHLAPDPHEPGSYVQVGGCPEFPPIQRRETGLCGAVGVTRTGVVSTYPSDAETLPTVIPVSAELLWVDGVLVRHPAPERLCRGLPWEELLDAVRAAGRARDPAPG